MMNLRNICKFKEFDDEFEKHSVGNKEFDHELDDEIGSKNLMMMMIIFCV
jgi:hypothetical protein